MARFLREGGGLFVKDIILIAESQSEKESFSFFEKGIGETAREINSLE